MLRRIVWAAFVVALMTGCAPAERDDVYDVTTLVLPAGHPDAGRQTFASMGCTRCHRVSWEPEFDPPTAVNEGPTLDARLSARAPGFVATAITAPSYHVPAVYAERTEAGMSPMADFSDALTIRDLADIVAYLRAQESRIESGLSEIDGNKLPHEL